MATENQKGSETLPIEPALLDWAEYWYPISWKGVLAGGVITAIGACATIAFLLLQWRTTSIREEQSEWRTTSLETQTAQANAALGTAQADIAKANAQIADAGVRIADANARAAEANQKAESERLERLKIEAALSQRRVTLQQRVDLTTKLKGLNISVTISLYSEPDCVSYAQEIAGALQGAGLTVKQGSSIMAGGGVVNGVLVEETAHPTLIKALAETGIATALMPPNKNVMFGTGENANAIFVGHKPNPF